MTYYVRDINGILLMKLENRHALDVINGTKGHFRNYRSTTDLNSKTAYVLDEDTAFRMPFGSLYLWEGTLLIPE